MVADYQKGFAVFLVRILFAFLTFLMLPKLGLVFISKNVDSEFISHKNALVIQFRVISKPFMTPLAEG